MKHTSSVCESTSDSSAMAACTRWMARAMFPKVMEFKVISRESEKHEFMPVVYLIERSAAWKQRVPRAIEQQLVHDYIAPLLPIDSSLRDQDTTGTVGFTPEELAVIGSELQQRTELIKSGTTREVCYKMGVLVNYAATPTLQKSQLFQVVRRLLLTLGDATHKRALFVPVSMHFCQDNSVFNTRRFAGIRYGAPVLITKRDVEVFQDGPLEYVHHITAKLVASLKMPPPQTAAQMEILRLSRSLHVFCARVYRDDCFSRRQIASMNEEILQIHFRTRNHPDMHALKAKMQEYVKKLRKWRLRDEDINTATIAATMPSSPSQIAGVVASMLLRLGGMPYRLLMAGASDLVYLPEQHSKMDMVKGLVAVAKCFAALMLSVLTLIVARTIGSHWVVILFVVAVLALHSASVGEEVAAHWKKIQFHLMDAAELRELKDMRALLARRIHALVAQYVSADLPPPVLESPSGKVAMVSPRDRFDQEETDPVAALHQYTLNLHHKIFINAPRSFPMDVAEDVDDAVTARKAVYAPKMLRDEVWRNIYGTLAPAHLQFASLLADNKGDSLPMDRLLSTPFFNAVLTAYMSLQKSRTRSGSDLSANEDSWLDDMIAACDPQATTESGIDLGPFKSVREVVEAALDLAEEEEALSS